MRRGSFPEIRRSMLDFVGQYLVDFERSSQAQGLTLAQSRVLGFAAIEPQPTGSIAEQFGCDPSNITAKVDRLVELGLAERRPDPADGRIKLVAATPAGIALSAKICHSRDWLADVLGGLNEDDAETVRRAFDLLARS